MLNFWHNASDTGSRVVELHDDGDETMAGPTTAEAPAPKTYALPTEWEQHRDRVRQLYLDENKPLKEVMAIMERDCGHYGRTKQYKNKIREWGFDTKYKRHQTSRKRPSKRARRQPPVVSDRLLASLAQCQQLQTPDSELPNNDLSGPATNAGSDDTPVFEAPDDQILYPAADTGYADYISEAVYPLDSINHIIQAPDALAPVDYNSQAPDAQDVNNEHFTVAEQWRASNTPNTTRKTPDHNERESGYLSLHRRHSLAFSPAVGIRSGRSATPPISIEERIFSLARRHIETSFTYGVWKVDNSNNVCTSMTCRKDEMDLPETYFDLIRSAVLLFQQGSTTEGQQVVSKAFALVKPILSNGNVRALNFFWTSLVFLVQFGHAEIVLHLIRYIYEMAQIVLHLEHPVVQMFKLLTQVELSELESLVHNTWQITADAFQKELPGLHPEYVRHQCDLIFRIYGTRDAATAEERLRRLLKDCENSPAHQTPELSHLTVLNAMGYNFMNSKDWASAVNIGQQLEERARHAPQDGGGHDDDDVDLLVYLIGGLEIQARGFNELKLIRPAVKCLTQATPLIATHWGHDDPWRIELMALQQNWLRENGEIRAADELKAEITSITERIDTDNG